MIQLLTLAEVADRFGTLTARRQFLIVRLKDLITHLLATNGLKQVYLFGSFVTGKASPNDLDLLLVMQSGFTTSGLDAETLEIFQHDVSRLRYHADVFWVTEAIGQDRINDLLEVFSRNREGLDQPIIEVKI